MRSQPTSGKNFSQNTQNITQSWNYRLNEIPEFSMPSRYEPISNLNDWNEPPQRNTKRTASSPLETNVQNKEPRPSPDSDVEQESETEMDTVTQMCHRTGENCDSGSTSMQTSSDTQTITVTAEIHTPSTDQMNPGITDDQLNDK